MNFSLRVIASRLLYPAALALVFAFVILESTWKLPQIQAASAVAEEIQSEIGPRLPGQRSVILPTSSMDARWWVIHTERMIEKGEWRARSSDQDNFPVGRSVHWSNLPVWGLVGLSQFFPATDGQRIQKAAAIFGPVSLLVLVTVISLAILRAFGSLPAAVFCIACLGSYPFLHAFFAGETDHHGLVAAFSMAGVLALVAGVRESAAGQGRKARWFFIASGALGAVAFWISASSQVPVLVGMGLAAIAAAGLAKWTKNPGVPPRLWTTWGATGGILVVVFYLLEYAPDIWHLRLEIIHPIYAFAWIGAGYLLTILTSRINPPRDSEPGRFLIPLALLATSAVALPVILILIAGEQVFLVSDPFLLKLLNDDFIRELQSLWSFLVGPEGDRFQLLFLPLPVAAFVVSLLLLAQKRLPTVPARFELLFALIPAIVLQLLALQQVRWSISSSALWMGVTVVIAYLFASNRRLGNVWRWASAVVLLVVTFYPLGKIVGSFSTGNSASGGGPVPVQADYFYSLIGYDVAARVRQSVPGSVPVILSGPSSSTELAYSGGARVIGTLYWENRDGLYDAAGIYSETNEEELKQALLRRGITHIVVFSWDDFTENYPRLRQGLAPNVSPGETCLTGYLAEKRPLPTWLSPLFYRIPDEYGLPNDWVRIYEFRPEQSPSDARIKLALFHLAAGKNDLAIGELMASISLDPKSPRPVKFLVDLLLQVGLDSEASRLLTHYLASDDKDKAMLVKAIADEFKKEGNTQAAEFVQSQIDASRGKPDR
ncbi:MAG: hypothetical protein ACOYNN_04635 [Terrimicrobiaceae bacterium]